MKCIISISILTGPMGEREMGDRMSCPGSQRFTKVTLPIHYNINTREGEQPRQGEQALTIHNTQTMSAAGQQRSSVSVIT